MNEQHIYHHSVRPNDCSKGHAWRLRFRNLPNGITWIKVCRRCSKVQSASGSFDKYGKWKVEYEGTRKDNVEDENPQSSEQKQVDDVENYGQTA